MRRARSRAARLRTGSVPRSASARAASAAASAAAHAAASAASAASSAADAAAHAAHAASANAAGSKASSGPNPVEYLQRSALIALETLTQLGSPGALWLQTDEGRAWLARGAQ